LSRIETVFTRKKDHKALITYVTVGYPSIESTLNVVPLLVENGCDIVELGIPFSDPLADGVTIQKSSFEALQNGITPEKCLEIAGELRRKVDVPLVFMTYYNPVFNYGISDFCNSCARVDIDGLIVPDLPPEESTELDKATRKQDIDLIYLMSPTSTEERLKLVVEKSEGFVYLVSVTGITGARNKLPDGLEAFVNRVRNITGKPLCVGFGISTPDQASRVGDIADGIIIGSKIIQLMEEDDSLEKVAEFVRELRQVLDSGTV